MRKNKKSENGELKFLTCEKKYVFRLLIFSAGMMGAYTFSLRGGVFCNAQTANFVMMAVALGEGKIGMGMYYLIPIFAYLAGAVVSEAMQAEVRKAGPLRWDTWLMGIEVIVLFVVGFIPLSVSDHVVHVIINFICSMQYNTYRQAEGIPMATTFCTNHLRQFGVGIVKYFNQGNKAALKRGFEHFVMIVIFFTGGLIMSFLCSKVGAKAIWAAALPLAINFVMLFFADVVYEKNYRERNPMGH